MDMSKEEYFFYEWLIVAKGLTHEDFKKLTNNEVEKLKEEFKVLWGMDIKVRLI